MVCTLMNLPENGGIYIALVEQIALPLSICSRWAYVFAPTNMFSSFRAGTPRRLCIGTDVT